MLGDARSIERKVEMRPGERVICAIHAQDSRDWDRKQASGATVLVGGFLGSSIHRKRLERKDATDQPDDLAAFKGTVIVGVTQERVLAVSRGKVLEAPVAAVRRIDLSQQGGFGKPSAIRLDIDFDDATPRLGLTIETKMAGRKLCRALKEVAPSVYNPFV